MTFDLADREGCRLAYQQTGKPEDVLQVEHATAREPGPEEVLVRITAAPINPADLNTIEGTYGVKPELPATPGIEGCGVVAASNSTRFAPGDRVMFLRRAATWATHTTVPADTLFKLPQEINPVQAAMLKVNPATAWQLLHGYTKLEAGDWVVQNLGNSAVGRCVIQIARDLNVRTISFVRRSEVADELRQLGADEVFTDDDDGMAAAKAVLGGAKAAIAFNAVGGDSSLRLMKLLRESANHVTYGAMGRKPVTIPNGLLIFRDIRILGLWVTRWVENAAPDVVAPVYRELAARIVRGTLVQPVDQTYPLADFRAALTRLAASDRVGKVLFTP